MVGEHIRALKGGRWIHAIDCGDETVLHLAGEPAPSRVRRAYRPEFVAGAASVEAVTHRERTFPPAEIVRRAYSRAADPALAAMFGDSEAFAEWCTSGRLPGRSPSLVAPPSPPAGAAAPRQAPARRKKPAAAAKRGGKRGKAKAKSTRSAAKRNGTSRRSAARRGGPRRTARRRRR